MAVENRGPELLKVCITLLTFAVIATSLRCVTRVAVVKAFGLDDWGMVFACISFILFVTCAITGIHYGTGRHKDDLSTEDFEQAMKYWWLCYIWYCVTMISSKLSIGVFLLRITIQRVHHYILYLVMFLSVVTGIVFFFVTLLQCNPINYFWFKEQPGSCINPNIIAALTYLYSAFSVICDFTFALLPVHIILGLQMGRRTKMALVPILSIACVASIAVTVRFAYIHNFTDPDFLWSTVDIAIWSTTEQGLGITAGSLATLQPLIKRVSQRFGLATRSPTSASNGMMPRTIGSMDKSKARKRSRNDKGLYSLTTFDREDPADLQDAAAAAGPMKAEISITREYAVTSKRGSVWAASEDKHNESEEELTGKSSKEMIANMHVVPQSFLSNER